MNLRKKAKVYIELNKGGCFPASTQILTPNGSVSISKLAVGDSVISFNMRTDQFENQVIIKAISHPPSQIVKIQFDNAPDFEVTIEHSVYTQRGCILVQDLTAGDKIKSFDLKQTYIVASIERTNRIEPVYNLITSNCFNFVADGLVVHNFSYFVKPREVFWSLLHTLRGQKIVSSVTRGC